VREVRGLQGGIMRKPELLAPAGDFEKLQTAIHYGADAVYLGDSRFSLRGKTGGFSPEGLKSAVLYAHNHGVRVYVTVNIFPRNTDLPEIADHIEVLRDAKPDAVILSDPGLFMMIRERVPDIAVHVSTQANITNVRAARFWESLGAKRLVLSRELALDEIRQIREGTGIELETFVHGSLCISYSGRCYISSFLASRSANSGLCTNSCRWTYALMEEKRPGEYFPVFEDGKGTYILSSKDLCMIEHLPALVSAGVDSFKIEGRMKGINYVAGVVKTYREAVDHIGNGGGGNLEARWLRELSMFSSRGYTTGMFFGKQQDSDYNFDGESYRMSHELVGVVLEVAGAVAKVSLRNRLDAGDFVEYLTPGLEGKSFAVESLQDETGLEISSARNEDTVLIKALDGVRKNDLIRRARVLGAVHGREAASAGEGIC
jgi:putative protease